MLKARTEKQLRVKFKKERDARLMHVPSIGRV